MKLFRAGTLVTMHGPPLRDGALLVADGVIREVGPAADLARRHRSAEQIDLGDVLVTPGLVNAHVHLELSDVARPAAPASFVDWLLEVIGGGAALGSDVEQASARAAEAGARESLRHGVTCVGDITRYPAATRSALARSPLRVVSFGEVQAMAGRRGLLDQRLTAATDTHFDDWTGGARLLTGVSPHAPYSIEPEGYRRCLAWARAHGRPITTHLAETPAEAEFLGDGAGPFRALWEALGDWRDDVPRFQGGPIAYAQSLGLLDHPVLLAHVNCASDADLDLLARGRASVVWCPRTHDYFGRPPHRFREMLDRGVNVCVGTDSRASAPDLNVLEDLRLLRRQHRDLPATALWELITTRAAVALGVDRQVGSLEPGKWADMVAWPQRPGGDPLELLLEEPTAPSQAWIAGERVRP